MAAAEIDDALAQPGAVVTSAVRGAARFADQAGLVDQRSKAEILALDRGTVDGEAG